MVLVTGATGHIGNVLVRKLIEDGQDVRVLALPWEDMTPLYNLPVEICLGDVLDFESLLRACKGIKTVYHLAGVISILPGSDDFMNNVNIEGTKNIIKAIHATNVQRLVYTSSIHAIQRAPHGVTIDESLPFDPDNPYGAYDRSKAIASLHVQQEAKKGLDAVIVCPSGVIGPFDFKGSEMGSLITDCIYSKTQFYIDGIYDFVDVRDVAEGIILARKKGKSGECYILSNEQTTILGIMDIVKIHANKYLKRIRMPLWAAYFASLFTPVYCRLTKKKPKFTKYSIEVVQSNSSICNQKAKKELGFKTRPLKQTIIDTINWAIQNQRLLGRKPKRGFH